MRSADHRPTNTRQKALDSDPLAPRSACRQIPVATNLCWLRIRNTPYRTEPSIFWSHAISAIVIGQLSFVLPVGIFLHIIASRFVLLQPFFRQPYFFRKKRQNRSQKQCVSAFYPSSIHIREASCLAGAVSPSRSVVPLRRPVAVSAAVSCRFVGGRSDLGIKCCLQQSPACRWCHRHSVFILHGK